MENKTQTVGDFRENLVDRLAKIRDSIHCELITLHLYDSEHKQLYLPVAINLQDEKAFYRSAPSMDRIAGKIVRERSPIIAEDGEHHPDMNGPFSQREKVKSAAGFPLKSVKTEEVLGVVFASYRSTHKFVEEEVEQIQMWAAETASFIEQTLQDRDMYWAKIADQQTAVTEIARDIVSNLEIDEILETILDRTLELLHSQVGSIALYDVSANELEFRHARGKDLMRRIKPGQGLVGTAASTKKPARVGDVTKDERYVAIVPTTRSELDVPLLVVEDLVGVLNIESSKPNAFSAEDENLAMTLASQAAIAIAKSRLFGDAERRAEALKSLHEVASELVSIINTPDGLDVILNKIAQNAQKVLGADLVDIYQYWKEEDRFSLPPVRVGERYEPDVVKKNIYKDDVLYTIIEGGEPLFVHDSLSSRSVFTKGFSVERANIPRERFVPREKIKSSASIPMLVDQEVVGVLFVNYRSPQTFPPQQRELIGLFSNQAAIAIRNNRLFSRLQKSNQELDALQGLIGRLTVETNLDKLLREFLQAIYDVLGFEYALVALVNRTDNTIESRHGIWHGEVDTFPDWIKMSRYSLDHPDIQADIVRKGQAEIISAWDKRFNKDIWDKFHHERLIRIFMPIKIQDEVIGVVEAGYDKENKKIINPDEKESLQAFVDQAALAIQRAEQFQEIERNLDERLQDIEALKEITEEMHQGDLDEVLNLIADRAIKLTGAKHSGVWLVNKTRTALKFGGLASKDKDEKKPPDIPLEGSEPSFSKLVVLSRKTHMSGDVRQDENYKPWYSDTVSELTVPIVYRQRVIGTINVESPNQNCFTEENKRLLEAMAGQAAVVIQNARLLEQLNILDDIGIELTSGIHLKAEEIIESIYTRAQRLTGALDLYIALYDEDTQEISFPLGTERGKRVEYPTRKADMEKRGKTEEIIFTRKPILHKTKKEAEKWYKEPGHEEKVNLINPSWLGVPMIVGERVLGVIAVYDLEQEHMYDDQDRQVFSSMASQAAIALENATLYYDVNKSLESANRELSEANDDLEALVAFGQEVTARISLSESEILEKIYQHASQLMDVGNMYVALYDEKTGLIKFPLMYVNGEKREQEERKFGERGIGKTEWIIQTKEHILHQSKVEADAWYAQPGHRDFFQRQTLPSWVGVPMLVGEKILGVIATFHPEKEYLYTDKDLRILQGIARVAAIILENTRLYYEARSDVIAARKLSTLGTAIAALQHRINNSFNIIIPNVTRLKSRVDLNDPTIAEILDIIERNARYTSEIIARIQEPLKEVEITDININAILEAIVLKKQDAWKLPVTFPLVTLSFNADERIPIVRGLSGQIAEIFENLMDNGHKAMPNGGEIEVVSELNNGNIMVRVIDCGTGIPQEIQERLFVRPVPSKTPGSGSGLGLWLSRLMLQSIGGDIKIESSNSTGTVMLVTIPVDQDRKES